MSNQEAELVIIGPRRVIAGSGTPDGVVRTVAEVGNFPGFVDGSGPGPMKSMPGRAERFDARILLNDPVRVVGGESAPPFLSSLTEDAATLTETIMPAGVTSIPTLRFHRDGTPQDFLIGARPIPVIAAKIQELLA